VANSNQNRKIRILVAESNELIRMGLRSLFENHPSLQLVAESDSLDGLFELAVKNKPDMILLDLFLSNGNCIEHIPRLLQASPQNRVLAFSSNQDEQTHLDALRSGVAGIFAKHQSTELLLKAIFAVNAGQVWFDGQTAKLLWQTQVISQPTSTTSTGTAKNHQQCLSARECSVACLASKGLSARKIGEQLFISEKTVRNQLTVVYEKLGVKGQIELCLESPRLNFCKLPDQSYDRDNCPEKKRINRPALSG
jgi:DNA-binding NarL/FixJ family response regulator